MDAPIWRPSPDRVASAHLTRFLARARAASGAPLDAWDPLYGWSLDDPRGFWGLVADFCGLVGDRGGEVVEDAGAMPGARWFPDTRLNFAENLLRVREDRPAVVFRNEAGARDEISFPGLRARVAALARALAAAGVGPGDRVAGYLPNVPGAVVAMLAASSLGAAWTSCSPDFGVTGATERFAQAAPRVLFGCDGHLYAGRRHDGLPRLAEVAARLPGVERVVVIPYLCARPDVSGVPRSILLEDFAGPPGGEPPFVRLPFDHPLLVLYSSGTTGPPKCIVHGAGGTLLQHLKEHVLHTDLGPGDRLLYFTTCGWMMWNWQASALAAGSTIVLYDGSPTHPDPGALWRIAGEERLTAFGTSARYLAAVAKAGSARDARRTSARCGPCSRPGRPSPRRATTGSGRR